MVKEKLSHGGLEIKGSFGFKGLFFGLKVSPLQKVKPLEPHHRQQHLETFSS